MHYLLLNTAFFLIALGVIGLACYFIIGAINRSNLSTTFTSISHHLEQEEQTRKIAKEAANTSKIERIEMKGDIMKSIRDLDKKIDYLIHLLEGKQRPKK